MRKLLFPTIALAIAVGISYEIVPPRPLREFQIPETHFNLFISPNGSQLISSPWVYSPTDRLRIWDLPSGTETKALPLPETDRWIVSVELSPDGQTFIASGDGKSNLLYSCDGILLHRFGRCWTCYSPDSRYLFVAESPELAVVPVSKNDRETREKASTQSFVSLWNIGDGRLEWRTEGQMPAVFDSTGTRYVTFDERSRLILWEFSPPALPRKVLEHHYQGVVGFDSKLQSFAEAAFNYEKKPVDVRLREMGSGEVKKSFVLPQTERDYLYLRWPSTLDKVYLCDNGNVVIHQESNFRATLHVPAMSKATLSDWANKIIPLDCDYGKIHLSESKNWLAIRSSNRLTLVDTGAMREYFSKPVDATRPLAQFGLTADGKYVLTADDLDAGYRSLWETLNKVSFGLVSRVWEYPEGIQVWDVERKTRILTIPKALKAGFSPDGQLIATQHADGLVRVWNIGHHTNWPVVAGVAAVTWFGFLSAMFCLRRLRHKLGRKSKLAA